MIIRSLALSLLTCLCLPSFAQVGVKSDQIFLQETFDQPLDMADDLDSARPDQWVASSSDGVTRWSWAEGDPNCDQSGHMVQPSDATGDCETAALISPSFPNPACVPLIKVKYFREVLSGPPPTKKPMYMDEQGNIHPLKFVDISSYSKDECANFPEDPPCQNETFVFEPPPEPTFRLYFPGEEGCTGVIIDNITVSAPRIQPGITSHEEGGRIDAVAGQEIQFSGCVVTDLDEANFVWVIETATAQRDTILRPGQEISIAFPSAGKYEIHLRTFQGCVNGSTRKIQVDVTETVTEFTNPNVRGRRPYVIQQQTPTDFTFEGRVDDPQGLAHTIQWLKGTDVVCSTDVTPGLNSFTSSCPITFDEPEQTTISLRTLREDGSVLDQRTLIVYVDPQLNGIVEDPVFEERFDEGQPVLLQAEIVGKYKDEPDNVAFWIYKGQRYDNGYNFIAEGHGQQKATFFVGNERLKLGHETNISFWFQQPNPERRPRILSPRGDHTLPPGGNLFFEASFGNLGPDERVLSWEILDQDGNEFATSDSAIMGEVTFENEGTYTATLYLTVNDQQEKIKSYTIQVKQGEPGGTDPEAPKPVGNGKYQGLTLDQNHYYETCISSEGQTLRVSMDFGEGARLVFFPPVGDPIIRPIQGTKTLNLSGLPVGCYTWGVIPNEESASTGKRELDFSFSIGVLNPALYFSDISEDEIYTTELGIVNPTGELAEITLIGYDDTGNILCQTSREIEAMGSFRDSAANIFGDLAGSVSWARVDSTTTLVGFSRISSLDELQSYAVSGASLLQPELYVPHIAENTTTWYTQARVVNGQESSISSNMVTRSQTQPLSNTSSFSKDNINFLERLGGEIDTENNWAAFVDDSSEATLAGTEIFGTIDGTSQVVGLGLAGSVADNPNFTTGSDRLYFTHITDSDDFWTGIAFVNRGEIEQGVQINAYASDGTLVDSGTLILNPFEKKVNTAAGILADADMPTSGIGWLEVQVDAEVSGYELFGTLTGGNRLAGIEAITEIKQDICFPYINNTGTLWHGVAVVNVSNSVGTVNFTLRNEVGEAIACVEGEALGAKEKRIFTIRGLFGEIPANAAWLEVNADQELVGFEIFGDNNNGHMSGLIAQ